MADVSSKILKKHKLAPDNIKLLIPHQANARIIDAVAQKLKLKPEQVFLNLEKYGNTTAGTIPIAMSEAYQNKQLHRGDWVVLTAFGAGYTWGSILVKWALE